MISTFLFICIHRHTFLYLLFYLLDLTLYSSVWLFCRFIVILSFLLLVSACQTLQMLIITFI